MLCPLFLAAKTSTFQPAARNSLLPARGSPEKLAQLSKQQNQITSEALQAPYAQDLSTALASSSNDESCSSNNEVASPIAALSFATIAIAYWYLLVFGAAAASAGLPVPDFIPLVPSWPPSDADLAPALEDSAHFFYIKDILEGKDANVPPVRLAVFNFAEAWIFAFLPVLLADAKRLPIPAVFFAWTGGLGLTNAFLAPYLFFREAFALGDDGHVDVDDNASSTKGGRNALLSVAVGVIATTVAAYAGYDCITASTASDWGDFVQVAKADRTYTAFLVDLALFSASQSFLLRRIHSQQNEDGDESMPQIYDVPFVGLMSWLFGV